MSDLSLYRELNRAKKDIIIECCKYFAHKYELEEHYKDYDTEDDIKKLCSFLLDESLIKGNKKKKEKDPDKPKKNMSAFMHFCNSYRSEVKNSNPNATLGEVAKMLGSIWQELESEDKLPFEQQAGEDKIRYKNEMEKYNNK